MSAIAGYIPMNVSDSEVQLVPSGKLNCEPDGDAIRARPRGLFGVVALARPAAGLTIVADVRLDEHERLARELHLVPSSPDIELLLAAFEKWGYDCPAHLRGDFAFAVWDGGQHVLFCARDAFGVSPFYYRSDRGGFDFATQLRAIRRPDDRLDHRRIAGYLVGLEASNEDTAFADIKRLAPGHSLCWQRGTLSVRRYASVGADTLDPSEIYVEGFRRRFIDAVVDHSRGTPLLGAFLSGGLDSSSIVSTIAAQGRPLRTFSFAYPTGDPFDESEFVNAVVARYPVDPEFVAMGDVPPLGKLGDLTSQRDDLIFGPGLAKIGRLLSRARTGGVSAVLDGHGGDEVVSHGYGRLTRLAREGRWLTLYRELRGVSAGSDSGSLGPFLQLMTSHGGIGGPFWRRIGVRPASAERREPLINRELADATDLDSQVETWARAYKAALSSEPTLHLWNVTNPSVASALEALRRVADQAGVSLRFPFYDLRLVGYALGLPDTEKLRGGWTRRIMRDAMEGILPERVRWRRTKTDFGQELAIGLVRHHGELMREMLRGSAPLVDLVDVRVARSRVQRLFDDPNTAPTADALDVWRMAYLSLWLGSRVPAEERQAATA